MIEEADKNNWIMAAACSKQAYNLVTGHVYTMLGVLKLDYYGYTIRLVKMRNPHGKEKYKGPWHDGDSKWTPALR